MARQRPPQVSKIRRLVSRGRGLGRMNHLQPAPPNRAELLIGSESEAHEVARGADDARLELTHDVIVEPALAGLVDASS